MSALKLSKDRTFWLATLLKKFCSFDLDLLWKNSLAAACVMNVVTQFNKRPVKRGVGKAQIGGRPFVGPFPADYQSGWPRIRSVNRKSWFAFLWINYLGKGIIWSSSSKYHLHLCGWRSAFVERTIFRPNGPGLSLDFRMLQMICKKVESDLIKVEQKRLNGQSFFRDLFCKIDQKNSETP